MSKPLLSLRRKLAIITLGGSFLGRVLNGCSLIVVIVQSRIFPTARKVWPMHVRCNNTTVKVWVGVGSDLTVLREVFVDQEYDIPYDNSPSAIIDVGANVGYSAIWFALRYPRARVWAYEPDPHNIALLRKNVSPFQNVVVCPEAIVGKRGMIPLYTARGFGMSSSVRARIGFIPIEVPAITLTDAITRAGGRAGIVKFDIEGAEYDMLRGIELTKWADCYIGEVHPDLIGVPEFDFDALFRDFILERRATMASRYILFARQPS